MGDTKESSQFTNEFDLLLGVKDTGLLEDLGKDGDGGVDGVGDDQDEGLGASLGDGLSKSSADTSVDVLAISNRPQIRVV